MADSYHSESRYYKQVSGLSTNTQDFIPSNGEIINITEVGGSSPGPNSTVIVAWDADGANNIVLATTSESRQSTLQSFTGDGVKVMRITLKNANAFSVYMGGYFIYERINF